MMVTHSACTLMMIGTGADCDIQRLYIDDDDDGDG